MAGFVPMNEEKPPWNPVQIVFPAFIQLPALRKSKPPLDPPEPLDPPPMNACAMLPTIEPEPPKEPPSAEPAAYPATPPNDMP